MSGPRRLHDHQPSLVPTDDGEATFEAQRHRLWGVAYRICGSRADADDVVQEAWLRWHATDRTVIDRPAAWLTTVTSRLAIDRLRHRRREAPAYVGPWLPDLISTADTSSGPGERPPTTGAATDPSELVESLTVGFLAMLERLDPIERVVFLLADVFGEPFADIASVVQRSEPACRQIASRARARVRDDARHRPVERSEQWRLAAAFAQASVAGDLSAIESLLAVDAVLISDGGATVRAARHPIVGRERIGRFISNLSKRIDGWRLEPAELNGEPGALAWSGDRLELALVIHSAVDEFGDGRVEQIFMMRNPDKLEALVAGGLHG